RVRADTVIKSTDLVAQREVNGADVGAGRPHRPGDDRALRIACPTRSAGAGTSMCSTPSSASASTIAFTTAPSAGVVPPSPPPRSPSGWDVEGTSLISVVNGGSIAARGIAQSIIV